MLESYSESNFSSESESLGKSLAYASISIIGTSKHLKSHDENNRIKAINLAASTEIQLLNYTACKQKTPKIENIKSFTCLPAEWSIEIH